MVGTNKNGVPNERSASILGKHLGTIAQSSTLAPLHIQRWDNALFNPLKKQILEDVEVPFIFLKASNSNLITCTNFFITSVQETFLFPLQTLQLTRDWILKTVNSRWRQYKSLLKQQHFNQQEKTLDEIIKGRPPTVNEIQWKALVGFWFQ
jgi:DNA-directed RNA polymerase subunit L